jgi:hypothetical protein
MHDRFTIVLAQEAKYSLHRRRAVDDDNTRTERVEFEGADRISPGREARAEGRLELRDGLDR